MPLSSRNWAGIVLPLALLLALLADGVGRFLSLDPLAIRAWETVSRRAFTEGGVPFELSRHYLNERSFGDLAAAANRPDLREYRREEFTSDAWGYRNLPGFGSHQPPDVILVGTSFSVGSGVSDHETLAVQLGRATGARVYNAAGGTPSPARILDIAKRLGMTRGSVILELLESNGFPERPRPPPRLHQECVSRLGTLCLSLKGWLRASPLKIALQRGYRKLSANNRWLPNAFDQPGPPILLPGGAQILFSERGPVDCPGVNDDEAREYFRWFRQSLVGFDLYVVYVPGKYSVYSDMTNLTNSPPPQPCGRRIAAAVNSLGIPFLDLTPDLRRAARERLARSERVYFLDDTHWNRHGIEVAAEAIAASPWRLRDPAIRAKRPPGDGGGTQRLPD